MHRDEAKHLLSLCRPGSDDDRNDPVLAEALALLETDAELRSWFDHQQTEDARIADALQQIQPPADLKASILAGMRAHAAHAAQAQPDDNVVSFDDPAHAPEHTRHDPRPLHPNAALDRHGRRLCPPFAVFLNQQPASRQAQTAAATQPATAVAGAPDVVQFLANQIGQLRDAGDLHLQHSEITPLRTHLAGIGAPTPKALPARLSGLPTLGCMAFDYKDCKLSMICFKNHAVYHLITGHKDTIGCVSSSEPQFFEVGGQAFKLWAEGDQVYIIAVEGNKENLPEFI